MNTSFWNLMTSVNINGRLLSYPGLTIEHEIDFSSTATGKVKIYNAAPETVAACEKKNNIYAPIIIGAGYEEDLGIVLIGEIIKHKFTPGLDSALELTVKDASKKFIQFAINKSFRNIKASDLIREIAKIAEVDIEKLELNDDRFYRKISFFGKYTVDKAFGWIARSTKSKVFYRYGSVNFLKSDAGYDSALEIDYASGLIKATKTTSGFILDCLYLYRIGTGSIIEYIDENLESNFCKVRKGKHTFSPTGESGTQIEVDIIQ